MQLKTIESEKVIVIKGALKYCKAGIKVIVTDVSASIVGLVIDTFINEVVEEYWGVWSPLKLDEGLPIISVPIIDHYNDPLNLTGLLINLTSTWSLPTALNEIWLDITFIDEVIILVFCIPVIVVFWLSCRSLGKLRENIRVVDESMLIEEISYVILKIVWAAKVVIVFRTVKVCWFCISCMEVVPEPMRRLFVLLRLNDMSGCLAER